jgi:hypothetical protein
MVGEMKKERGERGEENEGVTTEGFRKWDLWV